MKFKFTAESLWNVFRMTLLMSDNIKSLTLSFKKHTEQVKVLLNVSDISDNELGNYFSDLMRKTLRVKKKEAKAAGTNAYKFRAEGFSSVKKWIEVMPKGIIKSITITFNYTASVEVLVYMQDHVKLVHIQEYLQRVEEGDVMWESVQTPENYIGRPAPFEMPSDTHTFSAATHDWAAFVLNNDFSIN
jgi:hypothetical protein